MVWFVSVVAVGLCHALMEVLCVGGVSYCVLLEVTEDVIRECVCVCVCLEAKTPALHYTHTHSISQTHTHTHSEWRSSIKGTFRHHVKFSLDQTPLRKLVILHLSAQQLLVTELLLILLPH